MTNMEIVNLALLRIGVTIPITNLLTDTTPAGTAARLVFDNERDFCLRDFPWPFATAYAELGLVDTAAANRDWLYAYRYPDDALKIRRLVTGSGRDDTEPAPFRRGRKFLYVNDTTTSLTLSSLLWTVADLITVTASAGYFAASDVGNDLVLELFGDTVRISITEYVSATVVRGTPDITVPVNFRNTGVTTWSKVHDGPLIYTNEAEAVAEYTFAVTDPEEFDSDFISMLAWRLAAALAMPVSRKPELTSECLGMYEREKERARQNALSEGQVAPEADAEWIRARGGSGGRRSGSSWGPLAGGGLV